MTCVWGAKCHSVKSWYGVGMGRQVSQCEELVWGGYGAPSVTV